MYYTLSFIGCEVLHHVFAPHLSKGWVPSGSQAELDFGATRNPPAPESPLNNSSSNAGGNHMHQGEVTAFSSLQQEQASQTMVQGWTLEGVDWADLADFAEFYNQIAMSITSGNVSFWWRLVCEGARAVITDGLTIGE